MMEDAPSLECTSTHIDDISVISKETFEDHLKKTSTVLDHLQKHDFWASVKCVQMLLWTRQSGVPGAPDCS